MQCVVARLPALWEVTAPPLCVLLDVRQPWTPVLGLFRDIWMWFLLSLVLVLWIAQSCITADGTMSRTGSVRINRKILLKCIDCKKPISSGNTVV